MQIKIAILITCCLLNIWAQATDQSIEQALVAKQQKTDLLAELMMKSEQCWSSCSQDCALKIVESSYTQSSDAIGQCYSACGCKCNRGCTNFCRSLSEPTSCLQGCSCTGSKNQIKATLRESDDYFLAPLAVATSNEQSEANIETAPSPVTIQEEPSESSDNQQDSKIDNFNEDSSTSEEETQDESILENEESEPEIYSYQNAKLPLIEAKWDEYYKGKFETFTKS